MNRRKSPTTKRPKATAPRGAQLEATGSSRLRRSRWRWAARLTAFSAAATTLTLLTNSFVHGRLPLGGLALAAITWCAALTTMFMLLRRISRHLGIGTATAAVGAGAALLVGAMAALLPHCPGQSGRCGPATIGSWVLIMCLATLTAAASLTTGRLAWGTSVTLVRWAWFTMIGANDRPAHDWLRRVRTDVQRRRTSVRLPGKSDAQRPDAQKSSGGPAGQSRTAPKGHSTPKRPVVRRPADSRTGNKKGPSA